MKIFVIGAGHRFRELVETADGQRHYVVAVTDGEIPTDARGRKRVLWVRQPFDRFRAEPPTFDADDLVILVHHDPAVVSGLLRDLGAVAAPEPYAVLASSSFRPKAGEFPALLRLNDAAVLAAEWHQLLRDASEWRKVRELRRIAAAKNRILALIYGNPDPDAVAGAYALRELLGRNATTFTIAYTGEIGRLENAALIRALRLPLVPFRAEMIREHDGLAVVDAQPSFFTELELPDFDIVIDHHPAGKGYAAAYTDVRPHCGSTSTIFTHYFRRLGLPLSRRLATALYYGLKTDTQSLQRTASDDDLSAFRILRETADLYLIRKVELSRFDAGMLDEFARALARKRIVGDTLFVALDAVPNTDALVHIADFFMQVDSISWVVVAGRTNGTVVVVFRSDGWQKDAGKVAAQAFGDIGSAGGHRTMARAEIPVAALTAQGLGATTEELEAFLMSRLSPWLRALKKVKVS